MIKMMDALNIYFSTIWKNNDNSKILDIFINSHTNFWNVFWQILYFRYTRNQILTTGKNCGFNHVYNCKS